MALPPHLADLEGRLASRVDEALAGFRRAFETRLREATDRLLADAAAVTPPSSAALLAEIESEALEEVPRREGARAVLAELLAAVRAFDRASTQAEVLSALLAAGRVAADRRALLIVRDDRLLLFGSEGYSPAPESGGELVFDGTLRERLSAARGCLELGAETAAEVGAQLGWPGGGPALVVPLVLRDRIAALLWADRGTQAPELAPLQLLTQMAAQRLELQALSAREFTPTLYEGTAAPGAPLPFWSSEPAAPPPSVAPQEEAGEPPLDAAAAFEIVGEEGASAVVAAALAAESGAPVEPAAELAPGAGASWSSSAAAPAEIEAVADELWSGATTAEFDAAQFEAAAEPAVEADLETGIEAEPAAERVSGTAVEIGGDWTATTMPEPDLAATPPVVDVPTPAFEESDDLQTRRLPVLNFPLVGAGPQEITAPFDLRELPTPSLGASTHEFQMPAAPAEIPPVPSAAPPQTDLSEDATLLTQRFPLMQFEPEAEVERGAEPKIPWAPLASTAELPVLATPSEVAPFVAPPAGPVEDLLERTASRQRSTEVAPPPDLQGPGRAFLGTRAQRAQVDSPTHEEAKRLARLLISEIKLYNEEQVLEGRRNRDLYHRLKEDIDRSRQIYEERIDSGVRSGSDYFHQELVRSLAGGDPRALGI